MCRGPKGDLHDGAGGGQPVGLTIGLFINVQTFLNPFVRGVTCAADMLDGSRDKGVHLRRCWFFPACTGSDDSVSLVLIV